MSLNEAITKFIKTVIKPATYETYMTNINSEKAAAKVMHRAYATFARTCAGIKKFAKWKLEVLIAVARAMLAYFNNPAPKTAEEFDTIHHNLCMIWVDGMGKYGYGQYGKAQKLINIAFKYFRCFSDAEDYIDHFKFCHMPLDSYTLAWIEKNIGYTTTCPWSKMEEEEYTHIQELVRAYVTEGTVLEKEFTAWDDERNA